MHVKNYRRGEIYIAGANNTEYPSLTHNEATLSGCDLWIMETLIRKLVLGYSEVTVPY